MLMPLIILFLLIAGAVVLVVRARAHVHAAFATAPTASAANESDILSFFNAEECQRYQEALKVQAGANHQPSVVTEEYNAPSSFDWV